MNVRFLRAEDGYTLLETVVSLALFLSVLIPTGVLIGNMFLDDRSDQLQRSLHECESEMTRVITEKDFTNGTKSLGSHLIIERTVIKTDKLIEIEVTSRRSDKEILRLHKTLLSTQ